jgi:hypothetical protein
MNARRFYVVNDHGETGPFDEDELRSAVAEGVIALTDHVRSGMGTAMGTVAQVLGGAPSVQAEVEDDVQDGAPRRVGERWSLVILVVVGIVAAVLVKAWTQPVEIQPATTTGAAPVEAPAPPAQKRPPPTAQAIAADKDGWLLVPDRESAKDFSPTVVVGDDGKDKPAYLLGRSGYLLWKLHATTPGTYRVIVRFGCPASDSGSTVDVLVGDQKLSFVVEPTERWDGGREARLGDIRIDQPGEYLAIITAQKIAKDIALNVVELKIRRNK